MAAAGSPIVKPAVCPDKDAPDFDFTGSALLVDVGNGRQLIVVGNKSGVIFGFDPGRVRQDRLAAARRARVVLGGSLLGIRDRRRQHLRGEC